MEVIKNEPECEKFGKIRKQAASRFKPQGLKLGKKSRNFKSEIYGK